MAEEDSRPSEHESPKSIDLREASHDELVDKFKTSLGVIQGSMRDGFFYTEDSEGGERTQMEARRGNDGATFFARTQTGAYNRWTGERISDFDELEISGEYTINGEKVSVRVSFAPENDLLSASLYRDGNAIASRVDIPGEPHADTAYEEMRNAGIAYEQLTEMNAQLAPHDSPYPFAWKLLEDFLQSKHDGSRTRDTFRRITKMARNAGRPEPQWVTPRIIPRQYPPKPAPSEFLLSQLGQPFSGSDKIERVDFSDVLSGSGVHAHSRLISNPKETIDQTSSSRHSFREIEENRGTRMVDMNSEAIVFADPDTRVAIGTSALRGCTAVVVLAKDPDDPMKRAAVLGHYSPMSLSASGQHRHKLPGFFGDLWREGMMSQAFIISPGQWDMASPTGLIPKDGQYNTIT